MKQEKGYSVYTMLHIAMNLGKIDKNETIDIQWEIAESLYADYEESKYNQGGMSEYDCIANYLQEKELKHKVLASRFIDWYYSDSSEIKELGYATLNEFKTSGKINMSIQDIYDQCGYIPKYLCEDNDGIDQYTTEYNIDEVELINDFK